MATPRSLDGSTDHFPNYMKRAQGVRRLWSDEARCKQFTNDGLPAFAWTVEPTDHGPQLLGRPAAEWIEMAVIECMACGDQYDCARFALQVKERFHTWAMPITDLKVLHKRDDAMMIVDDAEDMGVPVAQAVRTAITTP